MIGNPSYRVFEWVMSAIITSFGVHLTISPEALSSSRFAYFADIVSVPLLAQLCLAIGIVRMLSLYYYGNFVYRSIRSCAVIRAACAVYGALLWTQMGLALIMNNITSGAALSIGISTYFWLASGEIYSTYRAAYHVIRG